MGMAAVKSAPAARAARALCGTISIRHSRASARRWSAAGARSATPRPAVVAK